MCTEVCDRETYQVVISDLWMFFDFPFHFCHGPCFVLSLFWSPFLSQWWNVETWEKLKVHNWPARKGSKITTDSEKKGGREEMKWTVLSGEPEWFIFVLIWCWFSIFQQKESLVHRILGYNLGFQWQVISERGWLRWRCIHSCVICTIGFGSKLCP